MGLTSEWFSRKVVNTIFVNFAALVIASFFAGLLRRGSHRYHERAVITINLKEIQ